MLSNDLGARELLTAALNGSISAAEIAPLRRDQLRQHKNAEIKALAGELSEYRLPDARGGDRRVSAGVQMKGRIDDGAKVFETNVRACHRVGGKGFDIGPNLASSASQNASTLLTHILDPNQYVLPSYVQYLVVDTNGITHTGLLAAQTATSLTLKKEKGETVTLLKSEIDELTSSRKSLMPEGLEKGIPPEAMADLIAFLQEATKKTPGDPNSERDRGTLGGTLIEDDRYAGGFAMTKYCETASDVGDRSAMVN